MGLIFLGAIIAIGFGVLFTVLLVGNLAAEVEDGDRSYMDPLPPGLKIIWPLIQVFANSIANFYANSYLDKVEDRLQKTGVGYLLTAEQFVGLRFSTALIALLMAIIVVASLRPKEAILFLSVAPLAGYLFPLVWLSDTQKKRSKAIIRALPVYLDFITMAVEAGLNLSGALQQAMQKGPKGPLRNEFAIVMRDMRSGVSRTDAFKRMSERCGVPEITSFVNSIVQAEKMGASMAKTLRIQSEQRRNERFQRAEKQAMQAPVKLIFPLIVFIFPVTFIILGFPIAMKFLNN